MVAICTGPAFATDDAGNLIIAGERRKANPSPCAIKDANGLYTDPSGGLWTPDHVYGTWLVNSPQFPSTVIPPGTIINYPFATVPLTNGTCWPLLLSVMCEYGGQTQINRNGVSWLETAFGIDAAPTNWEVEGSSNYFADNTQPAYFDWLFTIVRLLGHVRLEPHTTKNLQVAARVNNRQGGGQAVNINYRVMATGYSVS